MRREHGRHDGRPRPLQPSAEIAEGIAHVRRICPGWLVMWSPWRRAYTAFSMAIGRPLVLDDATVTGIIGQILRAESALSRPPAVH